MAVISLSEASIRSASDLQSFERGEIYAAQGRVRDFQADAATANANVEGTRRYRVSLTLGPGGLDGECTCPYGEDGAFCKHCVAAALVWLDESDAGDEPAPVGLSDEDLHDFLREQDPKWLADHLMAAAQSDPLLRAHLEVAAGGDPHEAYDDNELRNTLIDAIAIHDFVDYRGAFNYTSDVHAALDQVEALIEQGFPDTAIDLAEFALDLIGEAMHMVDDSDGGVGSTMGRAQDIHLAACRAGNPDPVALADRIVTSALNSDWEVFLDAVPEYADVLGTDGMARYREIVESAWRALPPKEPGAFQSERFRPTFLMERLAAFEGGTDAFIEVVARDLDSSYDVLRIANALVADGRNDEALAWAEHGIAEYRADSRLRTLAAQCHQRVGNRDDALRLLWDNFADRPSLETYQVLHEAAGDAIGDWRPKALDLLRAQPKIEGMPGARHVFAPQPGHTTLVKVLLWEDDVDAAWSAANDGGCHGDLWIELARERGKTHPADAIPILKRAAEDAISEKQRSAYQVAAGLLRDAQTFAGEADVVSQFNAYMHELRAAHKAKRALREELDRAGLPGSNR